MTEELRVHYRGRARVRACETHVSATLGIQIQDIDRESVAQGERERIGVAAGRLENDLDIGACQLRERAHKTGGLEHVARKWAGPEQRVLDDVCQVPGGRTPR